MVWPQLLSCTPPLGVGGGGIQPGWPKTSRLHYKPFGETIETQQDDVGYTGHKHDADLGLTYMQARYYDPVLGRFYGNDPVGFVAKSPVHSFGRYTYVNNNPYNYVDPDGEYGIPNSPSQMSAYSNIAASQNAPINAKAYLEAERSNAVRSAQNMSVAASIIALPATAAGATTIAVTMGVISLVADIESAVLEGKEGAVAVEVASAIIESAVSSKVSPVAELVSTINFPKLAEAAHEKIGNTIGEISAQVAGSVSGSAMSDSTEANKMAGCISEGGGSNCR